MSSDKELNGIGKKNAVEDIKTEEARRRSKSSGSE